MKLTIAILFATLAFSAAQITDEQRTQVQLIAAFCMGQEGAALDGVTDLNYGEFTSNKIDRKVKCFTNCVFERLGFLANGKLQAKRVTDAAGPIVGTEKINAAVTKCANAKGANKCQHAYLTYKCLYNQVGPLPGRTERS